MADEPIPDSDLVARAQAGDQDAYGELVRRRHGPILGLCVSMLGDREEADDAAEAVMPSLPSDYRRLEDADLVERALACLPPDYRLILTLRETQGLDYHELTQTLDCSLDAVKTRLKRARRLFEEKVRHLLGTTNV